MELSAQIQFPSEQLTLLFDNLKQSQQLSNALLESKLEQLMIRFEDKLAYDQTKQEQIDKLHEELQKYRVDLLAKTCRPLINGIIRLYQNIGKTTQNLKNKSTEELTSELIFKRIDDIQDDVQVLLEQHGVDCFIEPGEEFNPRRQRALQKRLVEDESMHGKVIERVRPGFEYASEILQKELINIGFYQPPVISDDALNKPKETTQTGEDDVVTTEQNNLAITYEPQITALGEDQTQPSDDLKPDIVDGSQVIDSETHTSDDLTPANDLDPAKKEQLQLNQDESNPSSDAERDINNNAQAIDDITQTKADIT